MTSSEHFLMVMWDKIVRPSDLLVNPEQRRLARLLSTLLLAMLAATTLANLVIFMSDPTYLTTTFPTTGPGSLALVAAYALSRTRHYRPAVLIVLVALSAASLVSTMINPAYRIIGPLTLTQGLLLAAFFFSARETGLIALANSVALVLVLFALPGSRATVETIATAFLVVLESATLVVWLRFRDQTERERQAVLLESAERFQHMADSVPILIRMSGTDMLCTYFNRRWIEFTGRPLETELGNGWAQGIHPDDLTGCLNVYQSAFKARRPFSMEYRLRRADGVYRWIRDDGAPRISPDGVFLGYIGGCVDISQQKEAEQVVAESEKRFRQLVESVPGAILVIDSQGKIVFVNERAEQMFGYVREELVGQPVEILLPDDLRTIHKNHRAEFFTHPDTRPIGAGRDLAGLRKDGRVFLVEIGLSYARTPDGVLALAILADITDRKHAEEELRHSEAALRQAQRVSRVGSWVWHIKTNDLEWSDEMYHIFGLQKEGFSGYLPGVINEAIHPEDRSRVEEANRRVSEEKNPTPLEYRVIWPDGSVHVVWAEAGELIVDNKGRPDILTGIVQDITDRKQAELQLAYQATLVDNIPDAVVSFDKDFKILSWNSAAERMFGWRIDEVQGRLMSEFVQAEIGNQTREDIMAQMMSTRPSQNESILISRSGTRIPVLGSANIVRNAEGQPIGSVTVIHDITRRKQAEEALAESEAKYRFLVDNSLQGMVVFQEGHLVFANAAMGAITGYSVDEMLAMPLEQVVNLVHPEDRAWVASNIRDRLAGLPVEPSNQHRIARADRQIRTVELLGSLITYQGKPALQATYIDITERVQAEQELERYRAHLEELVRQRTAELQAANEQLVRLGKAKDEFVSNVSHELRTPLTNIKLRQWLVRSQPEALEKHLGVMERETERLRVIIEELLELSRLDQNRTEFKLAAVNLNELISRYVSDRSVITDTKKLRVAFKGKARQPMVSADKGLLEEVLGVLMTNATNYTPAGGNINISTSRLKKQGRRWVGFSVVDTGPGIQPDDMSHMFERFFRGQSGKRSQAAGTGLGLALAKQIVERHGGLIEVASSGVPGEGARFDVWLPESPP